MVICLFFLVVFLIFIFFFSINFLVLLRKNVPLYRPYVKVHAWHIVNVPWEIRQVLRWCIPAEWPPKIGVSWKWFSSSLSPSSFAISRLQLTKLSTPSLKITSWISRDIFWSIWQHASIPSSMSWWARNIDKHIRTCSCVGMGMCVKERMKFSEMRHREHDKWFLHRQKRWRLTLRPRQRRAIWQGVHRQINEGEESDGTLIKSLIFTNIPIVF